MRATIYEDGVKRIKAKILQVMDIDDVSKYIHHALTPKQSSRLHGVQNSNKRELLQLAKDEVRNNGVNINGTVDNDTRAIVTNYIEQMFPELK